MTSELLFRALGIVVLWLLTYVFRSARVRQLLLLAASYIFYSTWGVRFLPVLLFSSLVNFALGRWIRSHASAFRLTVGLIFNLALLGFFKYLPQSVREFAPTSPLAPLAHLALPLGVSFWTFQAISYLFDLYRENELDPTLLEFCLYMSFFPTVVSGPICRLTSMLPQFRQARTPTWPDVALGIRRIAIGALMTGVSLVLATGFHSGDGLNAVWDQTGAAWGMLDIWCLAIGFGFLLFYDFCGYSHIVIGIARLFGFELQENFARPYIATTIQSFWTRWHMSLSFWIRDYVFLPLATVQNSSAWRNFSLFFSMVVFGLWHRASWPFLVWGAYQGLLLVLHRQWQVGKRMAGWVWKGTAATIISWIVTFTAVNLGWIFFRASSLPVALNMLKTALSPSRLHVLHVPRSTYQLVLMAALGYFLTLASGTVLDWIQTGLHSRRDAGQASLGSELLRLACVERWVWVAPLATVVAIYAVILARSENAAVAAPTMYRLF
jgi:D-alanyl-lipoteichoic acid acyltransferase DltB (MBOAT superfamily)